MFWNKKKKDILKKPFNSKKVPSKQTLVHKLDNIFSLYIRLRDSKQFNFQYFLCPTCGKIKPFAQADCCHYISRRYMALRWSEINCHIGCRQCNRYLDGNLLEYRKYMVKTYGENKVDMLESRRYEVKKWSNFELEALIDHYKEEVKKLKP